MIFISEGYWKLKFYLDVIMKGIINITALNILNAIKNYLYFGSRGSTIQIL